METIFLFLAIWLLIHSIFKTIEQFIKVKCGVIPRVTFTINIISISLSLTYILWYCN